MYNLWISSWSDHIGGLCATTSQVWARPGLVSDRDQFKHVKWWCEECGIHQNGQEWDVWWIEGYSSEPRHRGVSRVQWLIPPMMKPPWACTSWSKSWKSYSDLLVTHPRKCSCALADMVTWVFSSRWKVMKSLLMGTWHKNLCRVYSSDSCIFGYE
jgi:hypothetical protein